MFKCRSILSILALSLMLAACSNNISNVEKDSPSNNIKSAADENQVDDVLGIGRPISETQMHADALMDLEGHYTLSSVMEHVASTYNVAVRYANGVRKDYNAYVLISKLGFNEARSYIEDVYKVQIVREGERRLLVMPAADEARIAEFSPGTDVTLGQAVRGLAKQCKINLVITENKSVLVNTKVTTTLRNITCTDAFDALLAPHGLSLIDAGDYFTIGGLPERTWAVNLMEPLRSESQTVSYNAGIQGGNDSSQSDSGSSSSSTSDQNANQSGSTVNVVVREDRDLWGDLQNDLQTLLAHSCPAAQNDSSNTSGSSLLPPPSTSGSSITPLSVGGTTAASSLTPSTAGTSDATQSIPNSCGYVRVNRAVGLVQMQAPRSVLNTADQIIHKAQDIASRRLLVEARVMAVERTRSLNQGTDFAVSGRQGGGTFNYGFTPGTTPLRGDSNISVAGSLATLLATGGGGFVSAQASSLDAVARLVESYGTTYQLMEPTMEVMDRQKAVMIDGRNEIYFTRQTETVANNGTPIVNTTAVQHVQFVGIQFAVTAQIADGDTPDTLQVQIPITEIQRYINLSQTIDGVPYNDQIPIANTRVIDQKVRIRDGEVKVIGGLTNTIAIDNKTGQPVLRNLPLAGNLFGEKNITYDKVEFVVLLQVHRLH